MRKLFFVFSIAFSILSTAQTVYTYDYANNVGWTLIDLDNTGVASTTQRINISSGTLNFVDAVDDGNDIRAFTDFEGPLCNNWITTFDFNISRAGNGQTRTIAHCLLALTENNLNPISDFNTWTLNDAIIVEIADDVGANTTDMTLRVRIKDQANFGFISCESPITNYIQLSTNYRVKLERIDGVNGQITLTNLDTEEEVYNCCFTIPETLADLSFLQHSNGPQGGWFRTMWATIDNTQVEDCAKEEACCIDEEIKGPSVLCQQDEDPSPAIYWVEWVAGATYTWNVPEEFSFSGQGMETISLDNWNTVPPGTYVISVDILCGCEITTLTKTITIHPDLSTQNPFLPSTAIVASMLQVTGNSQATAIGINHTWKVYEAANTISGDKTILNESTNPVTVAAPGFGVNYTVGGLDPAKHYILQHIISFNGACEAEFRAKMLNTGASKTSLVAEYYDGTGNGVAIGSTNTNSVINGHNLHSDDLMVYPNPTGGDFQIQFLGRTAFRYKVYDAVGNLIIEKSTDTEVATVSLANFESGFYTVEVISNDGKRYQQKISKVD